MGDFNEGIETDKQRDKNNVKKWLREEHIKR
jgi:hypothetical protein